MRLPRNVSPAAAARRSWLIDVVLGLLLAIVAVIVAAGVGVVGFFALLATIGLVLWYLIPVALRFRRGRR